MLASSRTLIEYLPDSPNEVSHDRPALLRCRLTHPEKTRVPHEVQLEAVEVVFAALFGDQGEDVIANLGHGKLRTAAPTSMATARRRQVA